MAAGRKAFSGQSDAGTIAAILERQPRTAVEAAAADAAGAGSPGDPVPRQGPGGSISERARRVPRTARNRIERTCRVRLPGALAWRARPPRARSRALLVAAAGFAVWRSNRDGSACGRSAAAAEHRPRRRRRISRRCRRSRPTAPTSPSLPCTADGIQRLWIWSTESGRSQTIDGDRRRRAAVLVAGLAAGGVFRGGQAEEGGVERLRAAGPRGRPQWRRRIVEPERRDHLRAGERRRAAPRGGRRRSARPRSRRSRPAPRSRAIGVRGSCRTENTSSSWRRNRGRLPAPSTSRA